MAPNDSKENKPQLPEWVNNTYFADILEKEFGKNYTIKTLKPTSSFGAGENYASDMLRVEIELESADKTPHKTSYIVKSLPQNNIGADVIIKMNLFPKEMEMYESIIPQLENLFAEVGKHVTFGPKCWKVSKENGGQIIMEDLKRKEFVNAKRQDGLNLQHTKRTLEKVAQFHAASACLYEKKGGYSKCFMEGIFNESLRETFEKMNESAGKLYQECLLKYKNGEKYLDRIIHFQDNFIDLFIEDSKVDFNAFNVLNHGDLWCNNIMFQYNEDGSIKETYLVDYQIAKYGSPAQDLYYFLISSTSLDIKIKDFDYFIKYYHEKLVENLKLLKYLKPFPKLKDLHISLLNNKFWALGTATGVLTVVLMEPQENANIENFLEAHDEGVQFKKTAYMNPKYVKVMEALLPFLDNRGLLEF